MKLTRWLVAAGACVALTGCDQAVHKAKTTAPLVVAEVGTQKITADALRDEAKRRSAARRPLPDKEQLLQEMIARETLLSRARHAGLESDPAVRREFENLLISHLTEQQLTPQQAAVNVTPDEVRAEYDATLEKHTRAAQARFAVLFLGADAKSSGPRQAEVRARMEEARTKAASMPAANRARGVVGFGPLAIDYSDDQASRHRGGDIGWMAHEQGPARIPPGVLQAGWLLAPGQVSEVIETPTGYYLVMKTDSRERTVTPFESVQATLRQSLFTRKQALLEDAFRKESLGMVPIHVDSNALASVILPEANPVMAQRRDAKPPGLPGPTDPNDGH